jgi:hypothetical protein
MQDRLTPRVRPADRLGGAVGVRRVAVGHQARNLLTFTLQISKPKRRVTNLARQYGIGAMNIDVSMRPMYRRRPRHSTLGGHKATIRRYRGMARAKGAYWREQCRLPHPLHPSPGTHCHLTLPIRPPPPMAPPSAGHHHLHRHEAGHGLGAQAGGGAAGAPGQPGAGQERLGGERGHEVGKGNFSA